MPTYGRGGGIAGIFSNTMRELEGVDDRRNMAELAAGRFEQIGGPQAEYWAKSLRANPRAALTMSKEYGGFGSIEQGLLAARSAGQSQQAFDKANQQSAQPLTARQMQVYQQAGPAGLKAFMESQKIGQEMEAGPAPEFDLDAGYKLRTRYEKGSEDFAVVRNYYEAAVANAAKAAENPADPGAVDFALVQAYGKMLDPNSVVRNEEGKFIVESQSSGVEDAINKFARLFSAKGTLNPRARLNLMRQIEATYRQSEKRQKGRLKEMNDELDRVGAKGVPREIALPIGIQLSPERLDLSPWEAALSAESGATVNPEAVSKMKTATLPDGTVMVRSADGTWNPQQ